MKCGHVANAKKNPTGEPVCAICVGITKDSEIIDRKCAGTEGLEGRKARCAYYGKPVRRNETYYPSLMKGNCCGSIVQTNWELPFLEYKPNDEYDEFYCGCHGWD